MPIYKLSHMVNKTVFASDPRRQLLAVGKKGEMATGQRQAEPCVDHSSRKQEHLKI